MLDENEHSRKEDGRSLHRLLHKAEQQDATVVVDSAAGMRDVVDKHE